MEYETKPTISRLGDHVGQAVTLSGWVYTSRASGKIAFLVVRDGTGLCQCVIEKNEQTESIFDKTKKLPKESALQVTGIVHQDDRAPGGFELKATDVRIVASSHDYRNDGIDQLEPHPGHYHTPRYQD